MKIVCTEPIGISASLAKELTDEFSSKGHDFVFYDNRNENPQELVSRLSDADVGIISNIPLRKEVLERCPKLKFIAVAFTGIDHIDTDYCKQKGIEIKNASGYATQAVAELAIGLMIDVYRRITFLDKQTRHSGTRNNFLGNQLSGKTVGVVGTGCIGTKVCALLKAFGCTVQAYSRSERQEVKQIGVTYVPLATLMMTSDIITIHTPLTENTFHLIGEAELQMCKPSAVIINTARGAVVNQELLARYLNEDKIAAAGIDVFESEPPLPQTHPLLGAKNCVLVPHVGYATREAFDIRIDIVMSNIREWLCRRTSTSA
jgi:Lactate dehydrogenase and related dehydrogenases